MMGLLASVPPPEKSAKAEPVFVVGKPKGLLETGNIDILARPTTKNEDGSISTVRSLSFQDENGMEVIVPTVMPDGRIVSDDEAIDHYYKTGQHLGKFKTPKAAVAYAKLLHDQQEQFYGK